MEASASLNYNTTGIENTAAGYAALNSNATGSYNTANGWGALQNNTSGDNNTANGYQALYSNTSGNYNTAIGYQAGLGSTGSHNIAIGYAADGIRVNAIAPGWVATNLTQALQDDPQRSAAILARTPLARWARPEDIAGAAVFLCSPAARFVTGTILPVDGGYMVT